MSRVGGGVGQRVGTPSHVVTANDGCTGARPLTARAAGLRVCAEGLCGGTGRRAARAVRAPTASFSLFILASAQIDLLLRANGETASLPIQ